MSEPRQWLHDIPVEIRLKIYEQLFASGPIMIHSCDQAAACNWSHPNRRSQHLTHLKLFATSRAVRDEAEPVFWSTTPFKLHACMRKLQDSLPLEQYMQIRDLTYDATHTFNSAHPSTNRALTPIEKRLSRVGEILPSGQQVQRMNYIDIQAGLTLDGAGLSTIQSLLESTQGRVKTLILRINYATCYPEMPNGIVLNAGASILRGDDFDETYTVTMKDTYHITITGATVNVIEAMKEMLRAVHGQNYEEKLVIHTEDMREIAQRDSRPVPLQALLRLRTPTLTLNHFDMSPITVDRSIPIDTVMALIPSVQDNNAQGRSRRSRAFRRRNRGLRW